jgi:hypothetical protein
MPREPPSCLKEDHRQHQGATKGCPWRLKRSQRKSIASQREFNGGLYKPNLPINHTSGRYVNFPVRVTNQIHSRDRSIVIQGNCLLMLQSFVQMAGYESENNLCLLFCWQALVTKLRSQVGFSTPKRRPHLLEYAHS